jgi:phosphoribosylanthranilate isomerase
MMIKICGITRREDALAAADAGASAIGFIFYPKSPRYVTPEKARELGEGLNVLKVGVFVDDMSTIGSTAFTANLDVVQLYGKSRLEGSAVRVWRAVRVESGTGVFAFPAGSLETLFLDGSENGVSFDWSLARFTGERHPTIIAGGLDALNVAEAIRIAEPWGVDASSRLESAPGIKDHKKVRDFIRAARAAVKGDA